MAPRAPILLFGMPRSGTTWLGKIFDSHPAVLYRHEPDTWQRLSDVPIVAGRATSPIHAARLQAFVESLPAIRADRVCGKRPVSEIVRDAIGGAPLCDSVDAVQGCRTRGRQDRSPYATSAR